MKNEILDERIQPIADICSPLKVKVTLRCVKDKYYIHFDGSGTYTENEYWYKYWNGFDKYVRHILKMNGFACDSIKMKTDSYAICFVGTLFDFLRAEKKE